MLEEYWEKNRIQEGDTGEDGDGDSPMLSSRPKSSPQTEGYRRPRAISDVAGLMKSEQILSPHHPAISLPKLVNYFGPLIFTLYRAALLRKRILMVGEPPVEQNCNFGKAKSWSSLLRQSLTLAVYDLSVISSVPPSLLSLLPVDSIPPLRLRPLFNVGIQDIPTLEIPRKAKSDTTEPSPDFSPSWIACTTDDVLATKPHLYDILVNLPHSASSRSTTSPTHRDHKSQTETYPKIYPSDPSLTRSTNPRSKILKATQRDLRRYLNLRSGLHPLPSAKPEHRERTAPRDDPSAADDTASISSSSTSTSSTFSRTDQVVESTPWALIAYTSFIWWASAGEKKRGFGVGGEEEELGEGGEEELDRALLLGMAVDGRDGELDLDVDDERDRHWGQGQGQNGDGYFAGIRRENGGTGLAKETAIVGFFQRLTGLIFATVSDAISRVDGEDVRRGEGEAQTDTDSGGEVRTNADVAALEVGHDDQEEDVDDDDDDDEGDENAPLLSPDKINHKNKTQPLANGTEAGEEGEEGEEDQPTVLITASDMAQMGLDVWSSADRVFVEEFVRVWWGRRGVVKGGRVECCGFRVL